MSVLEALRPKEVFHYFEEICKIPHGSGNTEKMSNYLVDFAAKRGLKYKKDESGNVIIFKPGTKGYENSAPVIIQGHMDMVCEKDNDCHIDFANEGLTLEIEDGYVTARGTTLGGDDGIAVAYALAILDSDGDIPHPPLEVVITVDEEIGLLGANALDCSCLKGKILLNLDSEDEGILLAGCAGGATANCIIPLEYEKKDEISCYELTVTGITGGHSGVEINRQGANSNVIMGRVIEMLKNETNLRLSWVRGGLKDNVIPRESAACFGVSSDIQEDFINNRVAEISHSISREYKSTDSGISIRLEKKPPVDVFLTGESENKVIFALRCLPNGVIRMNPDIEGLVQTSLNMGIVKMDDRGLFIQYSVRSSVETEKRELLHRLDTFISYIGGEMTVSGEYPAWEYKAESGLRKLMVDVYDSMFHRMPQIQTIHAGLECGIFAGKIENLDCISFGPQIYDIHTTKEKLDIESTYRCYEYTKAVLGALK